MKSSSTNTETNYKIMSLQIMVAENKLQNVVDKIQAMIDNKEVDGVEAVLYNIGDNPKIFSGEELKLKDTTKH